MDFYQSIIAELTPGHSIIDYQNILRALTLETVKNLTSRFESIPTTRKRMNRILLTPYQNSFRNLVTDTQLY